MKHEFVFYEHTERAYVIEILRYVIRLLGDIVHSKVKLICKGGGGGEVIVIKLLLLNRKSKPLDLKKNNTRRARFPNSQIAGTLCRPHFGGKMH